MIVGSLVFWPVLIGMAATKDRKDELGKIKGEYAAVELQQKTKQCVLPPPAPVPEATKATTP